MIVIVLLVAAVISSARAIEYAHTTATPGNGEIVPLDIALVDNNTMITYPGTPVPPQDCFKHTINFHDFERGLVAMKIVDTDSCYIKPTTETYEQVKKLVDAINAGTSGPIKQDTEEWLFPQDPIPKDEVEDNVGENIARFCHGYTVYRMSTLISKVKALPRRRQDAMDMSNSMCAVCLWCSLMIRR